MAATLKRGSKGDNVKKLQSALNDLGHGTRGSCSIFAGSREFGGDGQPLKVDGIFGPLTEAMAKAYQKWSNLIADGIVGPKTQETLANWGFRF
jgi:peptidoglycan hydrolase-like protein with peptidoglycan-binding domain